MFTITQSIFYGFVYVGIFFISMKSGEIILKKIFK